MLPSLKVPNPEEREEIEVIPGAEYRARLWKVEERPNNFDPDKPQFLWFWRLLEPGYEDHPIWQWTSQKMGAFEEKDAQGRVTIKKSDARKIIEALLDRELMVGEELDWDTQIFHHDALLSISRKPRKSDSKIINKVEAVMPLSMVRVTTKGNIKPADGSEPRPDQPTQTTAALPESAGYIRRYELAKNALNLTPEQVTETIVALSGYNKPFWLLVPEDQLKVLQVLEPAAAANDAPMFQEDIPDFNAPPTPEEQAELDAEKAAKMPASTKHKVA
jgi:hypothetical protein